MNNRFFILLCLSIFSICAIADDDEGKIFLQKANDHYEAGNYDIAVGYYLKAAEFNEVEAMFNLGYALYHGEGITQDYPSAVMWFKRAANLEYPKAEYNLAFCYMNGKGVPCNYDKALKLLISSANHGFDQAQLTLSECYEHGVLVEQDMKESRKWKQMAEGKMKTTLTDQKNNPETGNTTIKKSVSKLPVKESSAPPTFDIELDGVLNERVTATTVLSPAIVTPSPKDEKSKNDDDDDKAEERAPLIVYAPGTEPPKKAPVLKILFPKDQSFFHTDQIKVKYQLLADGLEDSTKVIAMVDAVKKDPHESRAVKQAYTLDVDVPNRNCTVTLYAQNKAGNSEPVSIRLIRENVAQGDLPRLFCVAIGVGDYHDEKLPPLKLSTKDARDFAESVSKKRGLPFADVQVKLLTDKEATRADIFEAMEWLQQELPMISVSSSMQDMVIVMRKTGSTSCLMEELQINFTIVSVLLISVIWQRILIVNSLYSLMLVILQLFLRVIALLLRPIS